LHVTKFCQGQQPRKCIYSVAAQETAKHRAVWLASGLRRRCSNEGKTRNPLKFAGVPQTRQQISAVNKRSSPYSRDMLRRYCCLTSFFRLSIHAVVAKIQCDKVVRWCADGDFVHHFCVLYFQRAACSTFQTCILNSHYLGHLMCRSMVDIQSAAAEIRRGKKKDRQKPPGKGKKYNGVTYSIQRPL